jgi:hypothetical protein
MDEWNPRSWKYWEGNVIIIALIGGFLACCFASTEGGPNYAIPYVAGVVGGVVLQWKTQPLD